MSDLAENAIPKFSFGDMALAEEPGRRVRSQQEDGEGLAGSRENTGGPRESASSQLPGQNASESSQALRVLRRVVMNEESAPEILPFATEEISAIRALVNRQTEAVDDDEDRGLSLEVHLRRMELDRVNYWLRCYYRVRIKKIETWVHHVFDNDETSDRLSEKEKEFAVTYKGLVDRHFHDSFLSLLPEKVANVDKDGNVKPTTAPDMNTFVYCRVCTDIGNYNLDEDVNEDPFHMEKGDTLCVRYGGIRNLIDSGDVELT